MKQLLVLAWIVTPGAIFAAGPAVSYNREVRPILSDHCFGCHGPDAKNKGIPLRLDVEESAKADLGGRRAIVPGAAEQSEVVRRIGTESKARRMPPLSTGHTLTNLEKETLTRWIREGAVWEKHWSFLPPQRPELPAVKETGWGRNAIDRFVLARLEREGLTPKAEAAREKLIRRVTLDLTGLPPEPAEVDAFVADKRPDAYERLVDRLLARPEFGERLAMRWLDNARYADSNGYQYDGERVMWRWRDYVIESFAKNKPFDQFVKEQIAGDLLPNATMEQVMGTGFQRNHRANTESGIIPEEYAVEYVVDRVETNAAVFLGLTLGCARCHNHKYDPIAQKEFYQFFAYFNNVPENGRAMKYGNSPPVIPAPTREQQAKLTELVHRVEAAKRELEQMQGRSAAAQRQWERGLAANGAAQWLPAADLARQFAFESLGEMTAKGGEVRLAPGRVGQAVELDGKNYLEAGKDLAAFDIEDRFTMAAWVYSDRLPDGTLFSEMQDRVRGQGFSLEARQGKIHVHLTSEYNEDAVRVDSAEAVLKPGRWQHVVLAYTGSRMAEGIRVYVDGRLVEMKVDNDTLFRPFSNAGKRFAEPLRLGAGGGPARRFAGKFDSFAVWKRVLPTEDVKLLAEGRTLAELAKIVPGQRGKAEERQLREAFFATAAPAELRAKWTQWLQLEMDREALERSFPTVMVMAELPQRKPTHVLVRGEYNKPGEVVEPGLPQAVAGGVRPKTRLELAEWMVSAENPLLARVTVNRFWQALFGVGIVKTTEDFGSQGEWPSHPELLDWLAVEFRESGWDVKRLVKTMVTSAAYRQDSRATADLLQRDPENRLLARGPRLRLPAESIRDQALAAAGLLTKHVGGPSVKVYQPAGLWEEQSMQNMDYVQNHGEELYRRSLYIYSKRTISPPMMVTFDASTRESCVVREGRTNTPLQALNLMNDVTFLEAGRQLGRRMLEEGGATDEARLRYGFRLLLSRVPTEKELAVLRGSLAYHRDYFASDPERAEKVLAKGESPQSQRYAAGERAAWMQIGSLLLNLDEAVTKE